jgi:hypothetical protein
VQRSSTKKASIFEQYGDLIAAAVEPFARLTADVLTWAGQYVASHKERELVESTWRIFALHFVDNVFNERIFYPNYPGHEYHERFVSILRMANTTPLSEFADMDEFLELANILHFLYHDPLVRALSPAVNLKKTMVRIACHHPDDAKAWEGAIKTALYYALRTGYEEDSLRRRSRKGLRED